jgi:cell division protease FtsH
VSTQQQPSNPIAGFRSRPKEADRTTRRPVLFWDRIRIFVFYAALFAALVWTNDTYQHYGNLFNALKYGVHAYWWLVVLMGIEMVRQYHYLFEEHSKAYYGTWKRFWAWKDKRVGRTNAWVRYRLARLAKILLFLWVLGIGMAVILNAEANPPSGNSIHYNPLRALLALPLKILTNLPTIFLFVFEITIGVFSFVAIFWYMSKGGVDIHMPDEVETRFTDVKGQDKVLERVMENMVFLQDPESVEERGGYVPGGVLLWGPPGTGKTLMAQAVAGETERPFVFVDPGAFINMFFGVGILKVRSLYRKLRKLAARFGGVIVFFDEADSLGNRGMVSQPGPWGLEPSPWTTAPACNGLAYVSDVARHEAFFGANKEAIVPVPAGGYAGMGTLQALLSEMSGLEKPRGLSNKIRRWLGMKPKKPPKFRILHIFATNMPQSLDEAMLRPGRVDRIYKVGYPQLQGRKETFQYYLDKVKHELTDEHLTKLATISPYATGATIKDMVNEALVIAIRDARDSIAWKDIIDAKRLKEHGLPDDHQYIERERHSVAVHEACHAVVAYRLRKHAMIDLATIERRGDVGGFVSSIPPEDQFVNWRSEQEIDVKTFLASLAGERLFFDDDHTTGVGGDMRGATTVAMIMHAYHAMGDTIASHSVTKAALRGAAPAETGGDRNIFDTEFGKKVEAKLQQLYQQTYDLLKQNRPDVLAVAHALEVHKTLTGDDVEAVIEGTEGPLIDGRPYKDPVFIQELEHYHEACVAAHKEHGGVARAIPVPIPAPPVGALVASAPSGNGDSPQEATPVSPDPTIPTET